jgi:hypothetical protein
MQNGLDHGFVYVTNNSDAASPVYVYTTCYTAGN